jgi:hypothetical protein
MEQEIKHCDEVIYYSYEKDNDKIGKIFKKKAIFLKLLSDGRALVWIEGNTFNSKVNKNAVRSVRLNDK